jgi:hypothetical protein
LGLQKYPELSVFRSTFFSLLKDIHSIFGTLLCHTKIQIKFEFGFDPLIFPEVMALGLRNKRPMGDIAHLSNLVPYRNIFQYQVCISLQFAQTNPQGS